MLISVGFEYVLRSALNPEGPAGLKNWVFACVLITSRFDDFFGYVIRFCDPNYFVRNYTAATGSMEYHTNTNSWFALWRTQVKIILLIHKRFFFLLLFFLKKNTPTTLMSKSGECVMAPCSSHRSCCIQNLKWNYFSTKTLTKLKNTLLKK